MYDIVCAPVMFLYLSHALCSVEASRTYAQLLIRTMFVRYNTWSTRIKALDINIIPYVALQAIMFSHAPAGSWILVVSVNIVFFCDVYCGAAGQSPFIPVPELPSDSSVPCPLMFYQMHDGIGLSFLAEVMATGT